MIRTFNRQPFNVATPDKEDVNHKYLNQYNWKGKVENKNFIDVDQESFSDCNNIYVDEEGLLKSRPSLKVKNIIVKLPDGNVTLANIVDTFTFNNIIVYKSYTIENDNKVYRLTFVKEDSTSNPQYELSYNDIYFEDINLIMMDSKIFIFSKYRFDYYDIEDNTIYSAEDNIYIPTTKVITNGIDTETQVDEKNELTNKEYIDYLFYDIFNQDFTTFIGKDIIIKIGEETYNINFKENNELVFVDKLTSLTSYEIANEIALGYNCEGMPLLDIAENGVILLTTMSYGEENNRPTSYRLRYSVDGLTFTALPFLTGAKGIAKISRNGQYAIHYKIDGPYIISLLNNNYPVWTALLPLQKNYDKNIYGDNYFSIYLDSYDINIASQINGYYINDRNFSITYTNNESLTLSEKFPKETNCKLITCVDGTLKIETIYNSMTIKTYTGSTSGLTTTFGSYTIPYKRAGGAIDSSSAKVNQGTLTISNLQYVEIANPGTSPMSAKSYISATVRFTCNYGSDSMDDTTTYLSYDSESNDIKLNSSKKLSDGFNILLATSGTAYPKLNFNVYKISNNTYITVHYGDVTIYSAPLPGQDDVIFSSGEKPLPCNISSKDIYAFGYTYNVIPNVKMYIDNIGGNISYKTVVLFQSYLNSRYRMYYGVYLSDGTNSKVIDYNLSPTILNYDVNTNKYIVNTNLIRPCLRDDVNILDKIYFATLTQSGNTLYTKIITYTIDGTSIKDSSKNVYEEKTPGTTGTKPEYIKDYRLKTLRLSYDENYLLTDSVLFLNSTYGIYDTLKYIELLDKGIEPIVMYYADTNKDSMYYFKDNVVYSNSSINIKNFMVIKVLQEGTNNYTLFDHITQLSNYYFSIGKTLYISKNIYEDDKFKWYLPAITKEEFDDVITNIHPISANEVAIFLNNSIYYTNYDGELEAYRYYKAKIQVGCKTGSDVITTFDGKYIIFVSERGMVAMSYQEFVASTEQALTFMSDNIYDTFYKYNTEPTSKNAIKLYKYSNYIFVYKEDSNKGFIFDLRTLSWWPISIDKNISRFVTINNEVKILSNMKLFNLNKSDINYYDYDGIKRTKVDWFIQSQKLHLGAVNYYKHIVNITFNSVHDLSLLKENDYNATDLNFKLQINNYRKQVNGNIGNKDDYKVVNYNVEIVRTFVQRLNYGKVNEFQYLLSYDDKNSVNVPFSVSGIIVKYKIGGEVR